jgi:hypothetical protein
MISKITTISLLIVFIGCSSIKEISSTSITSSKYETVYSRTVNEEQFESIFQILKENISDFPITKKNKLNYKTVNNKYSLNISLKKRYFKLVYKSNVGYDDKIKLMKSKLDAIK